MARVTLDGVRTVKGMEIVPDESACWTAALAGDGEAFAVIFDLHRDRVYRHALRMTRDIHDAEDVTAGAFLELWRRRSSVRVVEESVLAWLLVTTTNLSRNRARGLRRYRALLGALPRASDARGADDAALEHIEQSAAAQRVRRALSSLSRSDAVAIALTTFEHCTAAELAKILGISEATARTRLHRARARMATAIESLETNDRADIDQESR